MKIAVTGGSGFIGTRLIALLESAGHKCVIVDTRDASPVDILDLPSLTTAFAGCDAIYHLAAEHRDDTFPRSRYYDVNGQGSENVTRAAEANGIDRIVFTSSFAVYGLDSDTPNEESPPAPFNDYGKSKLEGEKALKDWAARNENAKLTIVRPVVVFGEGNRGNVHTLIDQVARNRFVMVGDGRNCKSIAYVGNVAAFLASRLGSDKNVDIFNYADGPDLTMNELMALIAEKLGLTKPFFQLPYEAGIIAGHVFDAAARLTKRKFPISAVRVRKFCADTTSDASKAMAVFTPPVTLEEGLSRMVAHDFLKGDKAA